MHVINVEIGNLGILGRKEMWEVALRALPPISLFWREIPTGNSRWESRAGGCHACAWPERGFVSCPVMGGAMNETEAKDSVDPCAEVAVEPVVAMVGEVVGPKIGHSARHDTPKSLGDLANGAVKDWRVEIVEAIVVNIKGLKHLPSAKLLLELDFLFTKNGGVQPVEMQSFADLLIKSLEADMAAEAKAAIGESVVVEAE